MIDAENRINQEAAAFHLTDVHGYFELGRRVKNAAIFVGCVALGCGLIVLAWRLGNG